MCDYFGEEDTLIHALIKCNHTQLIWRSFFDLYQRIEHTKIDLKYHEIMLGITNKPKSKTTSQLNYLIILVKNIIYKTKYWHKQKISFTTVTEQVKYNLKLLSYAKKYIDKKIPFTYEKWL